MASHLSSVVADLHLHVSILKLLLVLLEHEERATAQRLSEPRSLSILQWITSHLPESSTLPVVQHLPLVFKPLMGVCGLSNEEIVQSQKLQVQVRTHTRQAQLQGALSQF